MASAPGSGSPEAYLTKTKRLARMHHALLRLSREEALNDERESEEIKALSQACAKCRGDSEHSDIAHMEDLCPADKKRISELIERLADSTKARHKAEETVAILEAEKNALANRCEAFCKLSEDDKGRLRSQLSQAQTELKKLRLQTSRSLDLLAKQIRIQEKQFTDLTAATRNLVDEKSRLEALVTRMNAQLRDAEANAARAREAAQMERLMLLKECMHKLNVKTDDRACQTQQTGVESKESKKSPKTKDDLEDPTADGKLIQDLFFKRPNVPETESLGLSILSLFRSK